MPAILGFLVLFAAYTVLVGFWPAAQVIALNDRQINLVRAERWLFAQRPFATVVVGSSLAARLDRSPLPDDYYILAFGGGSALTGIEIVGRGDRLPRRILVEVNVLTRGVDSELLGTLYGPGLYDLRRVLPSLRQENQPLVYALSQLVSQGVLQTSEEPVPMDLAFFQRLLDIQRRALAHADSALVEQGAARLEAEIMALQRRGVEIILFEMPIHPELAALPGSIHARSQATQVAERCGCALLQFPEGSGFETTDGLHLTLTSAERLARHLVARVSALSSTGGDEAGRRLNAPHAKSYLP